MWHLGVLPAFAALLLTTPAPAVGGGETPPSAVAKAMADESSSPSDAPGDVTFTRALIPDPPTLGEPFRYEIRFQGPPGTRLFFPPNPAVGPFHLDGVACVDSARRAEGQGGSTTATTGQADGPLDLTCTVNLRAFRLGRLKLPAVEAAWSHPGSGGGSVSVPGKAVEVQGTLGNDAAPTLRAAYTPLPIAERNWPMIIATALLATVAVTTVLTLLAVLILRRWILPRRFERPRAPAHVIAFGRLEALRPTLEAEEPGRDVFFALSEILREYLGNRYDFEALELTTREVMARLVAVDLQGVQPLEIEDVLSFADLVKFAKQAASRADAEDVFERTRKLVERTLYVPPETPDLDVAAPEFVHAPLVERLAASATDLALPFPLLAALRLSLTDVPAIALAAGWGAFLLLWLLVRDAAGPASPGHRLLGLRLLDERQDLLATRPARLKRNALLLVPVIGWTIELLVLASVTRTERIGDQWAHTRVAVPARRPARTWSALALLVGALVTVTLSAWIAGR